jgi:HK97 gp10 family phage protein
VPPVAEVHRWYGLSELEKNLKMLGEDMREKGVKRMMSQAAVPMRNEAKINAPILEEPDKRRNRGTVMRAISIWRKRVTRYAVTYYVGVRGLSRQKIAKFKRESKNASSDNPNDPFYWRFLEFGTSKLRARPFLRPAFEAKKTESVRVALAEGQAFVKRTIKRFTRTRKR